MVNIGTALGGLSGVYPAYTKSLEDTYQNQQSAEQLQGTSALGRAMPDIARFLQMMSVQGVPGVPGITPGAGQPPMAGGGPPGGPSGARPGPLMPPGPQYAQGPPVNPNNPDLDPGNQLPPIPMAGGSPPAPPVGPGAPPSPSPVGPPGPPARPQMPPPQGGGFTGGMGGMAGTGPALDLQTIIQSVIKNNPGAPPGVIARAVNSAIPLMNAQAQMEWKQFQAERQLQQQQINWLLGSQRTGIAQETADTGQLKALENANNMRRAYNLPEFKSVEDMQRQLRGGGQVPGAPGTPETPGAPEAPTAVGGAGDIYQSVKDGRRSPILTGLPAKIRGQVEGRAAADKTFNLAEKQLEWRQAERMTNAISSPQVVKWQATALSVQNTINDVRKLSQQLDMNSIRLINQANLQKKIQVDQSTPAGKTAQTYINKVLALRGELATLEQGGYAPTQDAWEVAKGQIDTSMAVGSMDAALTAIDDIVGYRLKAMQTISGGRFGTPNPYMTPPGGTPGPPGTPGTPPGAPGPAPPATAPGNIDLGMPGVTIRPRAPAARPFEPLAD